jgi:hypothetical protein
MVEELPAVTKNGGQWISGWGIASAYPFFIRCAFLFADAGHQCIDR